MLKRSRVLFAILPGVVFLLCSPAYSQRILIATTEQSDPVGYRGSPFNGEYIITDLVAAGYPFDVVTYGRFVSMPLTDYDIIFLSGVTSPTLVSSVAAKCQTALQDGRKVFVNGMHPYERLGSGGNVLEFNRFTLSLFNVLDGGTKKVSGQPIIPGTIEKDSTVTADGVTNVNFRTFAFNTPPPITITIAGKCIGFLCPQGGTIDGTNEFGLHLLDYGKVASYLRFGTPMVIGFANDRIGGKPIASFEVHCDSTNIVNAINGLNQLSRDFSIPLVNLLVYSHLNSTAISSWNNLNNPLMTIGSHSRNHPADWPSLTDSSFTAEAISVLSDQRAVIPSTGNYFNFSGSMNPTTAQIDQLYSTGVIFGAYGGEMRRWQLQSGQWYTTQRMPTWVGWLYNLSHSTTTPYCLSHTTNSDYNSWVSITDYEQDIKDCFGWNVRNGLYTFGFIHDYMMDTTSQWYVHNVHMSQHIRLAMQYLLDNDACFIPADQLILRLRDYLAGQIICTWNQDGSATLTVNRPGSLANQIKVGFKDGATPIATGAPVISQRLAGDCLYVDLKPETSSSVQVHWENLPPPPPQVANSNNYISNDSVVTLTETLNPAGIAEYQYAVGTSAGGTDAQNWTSNGPVRRATLTQAHLQLGRTYYISAKARYNGSDWSPLGVSAPYIADSTPPLTPTVTDDGFVQDSQSTLHASWTASDPESGVVQYCYAIGTYPGGSETVGWKYTTATQATETNLNLANGYMYYFSVKAENLTGSWSNIGSSNGMVVGYVLLRRAYYVPVEIYVKVCDSVCTSVFTGGFYMQSLDRAAGIKVITPQIITEGSVVSIYGKIDHINGEPVIEDATINPVSTIGIPKPLMMPNFRVGGEADTATSGPAGGIGLNNVCLFVRTSGAITAKGTDYIYVNDGSIPNDGVHPRGVKVLVSPTDSFQNGMYVVATGISSLEPDGSNYRRLIRTRTVSDVSIKAQSVYP